MLNIMYYVSSLYVGRNTAKLLTKLNITKYCKKQLIKTKKIAFTKMLRMPFMRTHSCDLRDGELNRIY